MGVAVGVAGRLWFGKSEKFRMGGGWMDSQLEMWENGARKISWTSSGTELVIRYDGGE